MLSMTVTQSCRTFGIITALVTCSMLTGCASRGHGPSSEYYTAMGELGTIAMPTKARWRGLVQDRRAGKPVDVDEALEVGSTLIMSMEALGLLAADAGLQRYSLSDETRVAIQQAKQAFTELQARDANRR
ncbi:MAG: hypothetical protein K2X32_10430 [Phycisphaerales bacterium]|nr:hypothetical protein [Phycisphaerales bacterium]